jgi:hypothetical protein
MIIGFFYYNKKASKLPSCMETSVNLPASEP